MTRRSAQRWLRSLLPLLALRLLLPVGVMPMAGPHGIELVPCSMGSPAATPMPAMDMSGMDMSGMEMPGMDPAAPAPAPTSQKDTLCVFAAAAGLAPVAALPTASLFRIGTSSFEVERSEPQHHAQSGPLRIQMSRAPPTLS